jgi:ribonucleoside-diphosphate reductase alpha chain
VEIARERGFYSDRMMGDVVKRGNLRGLTGIPTDVRKLFITALEIPARDHIEMQAAFQEFTDNAVSKTVNLPAKATKEDVANAYLLAYDKGVKGITVFRYGGKKGTLVRFADTD